jgi:hypothetical protein
MAVSVIEVSRPCDGTGSPSTTSASTLTPTSHHQIALEKDHEPPNGFAVNEHSEKFRKIAKQPGYLVSRLEKSLPVPWHNQHAASLAIKAVSSHSNLFLTRIRAAKAIEGGYNLVSAMRQHRKIEALLSECVLVRKKIGLRHMALSGTTLCSVLPNAANDNEQPSLWVVGCVFVAGKKIRRNAVFPILRCTGHSIGRFVERSGHKASPEIHAAVLEASRYAALSYDLHASHATHRLAGGLAPIILPAGNGAFLGHIRALPVIHGGVALSLEGQTWIHETQMSDQQFDAVTLMKREMCSENTLPTDLIEAFMRLRTGVEGDRRLRDGLPHLALGRTPSVEARMQLQVCPTVIFSRLELDRICPDTIAVEMSRR